MKPDEKKIDAFWDWFITMENQFKGYFSDDPMINKDFLVEAINNRVLDFGRFSWHMGEGKDKPYYFTISPNGNKQLMDISRSIVHAAPILDNWELHFAKPAIDWDFQLVLYDNYMRECEIDVSLWQYFLVRQAGNKVAIFLELIDVDHVDEDTQMTAMGIAITNIIGELWKIKHVSKIEILSPDTSVASLERRPISQLKFEFEDSVVV